VPGRGPSIYDVMLDTAAAGTMQILVWLSLRRRLLASGEELRRG
jgi:hypothetical protein